MITTRIVCLANSTKLGGRCVAGKDLEKRVWVRPISHRVTEELSRAERRLEDGEEPRPLDVLDVPLLGPRPGVHQPENWLIDQTTGWAQVSRASPRDLAALVDDPPTLWVNSTSSRHGINDEVEPSAAALSRASLYLLRVPGIVVHVFPGFTDKRRVDGEFTHRAVKYRLSVTDPVAREQYLRRDDGKYDVGGCFLTVSLGEPYRGYCYKLIAAIISE